MRNSELIGCQLFDAGGEPSEPSTICTSGWRPGPAAARYAGLDALECGGIGLGHRLGCLFR